MTTDNTGPLTNEQAQTLREAQDILRSYRMHPNVMDYTEGYRHGRAEVSAERAADAITSVLYYHKRAVRAVGGDPD